MESVQYPAQVVPGRQDALAVVAMVCDAWHSSSTYSIFAFGTVSTMSTLGHSRVCVGGMAFSGLVTTPNSTQRALKVVSELQEYQYGTLPCAACPGGGNHVGQLIVSVGAAEIRLP